MKLHLKGKINNILPGVGKNNLCVGMHVVSHDVLRTGSRRLTGEERSSSWKLTFWLAVLAVTVVPPHGLAS